MWVRGGVSSDSIVMMYGFLFLPGPSNYSDPLALITGTGSVFVCIGDHAGVLWGFASLSRGVMLGVTPPTLTKGSKHGLRSTAWGLGFKI